MRKMFFSLFYAMSIAVFASQASNAADGLIDSDSLFHDQGPLFASTNEPTTQTSVSITFRAKKGDLTAVTVKYLDVIDRKFHFISMKVAPSSDGSSFDLWQAVLPASGSKRFYRFKATDGRSVVWYNARGSSKHEQEDGDFSLLPGFKTPNWLKNGVIYQIFPDRFFNGDTSNDVKSGQYKHAGISVSQKQWGESPIPKNGEDRSFTFYGGDLKGIASKLPYIRGVGADIIYLNPIFKAPSNHKYDTSDYDVVDPAFGNNSDLSKLAAALHNRLNGEPGYLILDGVFNHTGDGHKWFAKYDAVPGVLGAYQSNKSPFNSFYTFKKWPDEYAHFMIYDSLPKLDFGSLKVKEAIYLAPNSVAKRYLKSPYLIDGWRLDAPKYVDKNGRDGSDDFDHEIWRQFRRAVKSVNPNSAIIGESWEDSSSWTAGGDQWDSVTNFNGFTAPVSQWITGKTVDDKSRPLSASEFERMLRLTRALYPTSVQQAMSNHLSNHDTSRFAERAGGDISKTQLALVFQMTYIGAPTIYYGDEYGIMGGGDPDCRRTFDWSKGTFQNETVGLTRRLIAIRKKYSALRTGSFIKLKVDDTNNVFAFGRMDKTNKIAVVLNNSNDAKSIEIPTRLLDVPPDANFQNAIDGSTVQSERGTITVSVPAYSGVIMVSK